MTTEFYAPHEWNQVRALKDGWPIKIQWHDGWRECKILSVGKRIVTVETQNGGIMDVDNLKAMQIPSEQKQ